jgi:hypothetical protein
MKEAGSLSQRIELEKPIVLKLVVLDANGVEDPGATRMLYNRLSEIKRIQLDQDDDSWMYHSRPSYPWW